MKNIQDSLNEINKNFKNKMLISYNLLIEGNYYKPIAKTHLNDTRLYDSSIYESVKSDSEELDFYQANLEYSKNGLVYLEMVRVELGMSSYQELPKKIIQYALKNFNIGNRPSPDTKEIEKILNIIDAKILPEIGVDYSNYSLSNWMLTSFHHISDENVSFMSKNHLVLIPTDKMVKFNSKEHKTYQIDFEKDNVITTEASTSKASPKLVAIGITACSVIILDDKVNKNVYITHIQPVENYGHKYQNTLGKFFNEVFTHKKSVDIVIIGTVNCFDLERIVNKDIISEIKNIDLDDKDQIGDMKSIKHKEIYYLPLEGKLIIAPTQNGFPEELPNLASPKTLPLSSSVTKKLTSVSQFFNQLEAPIVSNFDDSRREPICLPPMR